MKLKKSFIALLTALGVATNIQAKPTLFQDVSYSIEKIKTLSSQKTTTDEIFKQVGLLSSSIQELNAFTNERINTINKNELSDLILVEYAVNFIFNFLKQEFKSDIFTKYTTEFRTLSNAKNTLENNVRKSKERLIGIEIVRVKGLSLNNDEVTELTNAVDK
ncbi:hypothetical protein [Phocoenobacter skyensis]|uniref:Uncharacterized protein n=1 Tax=Phocoenobacter skyensis TaxID=97481 RepID=A0A1H7XGC0_9PAST|nr:hypothetical protein [Pasteurella skyensis]MDP8185405.1 hypothetical protein [Pasteurella skyensis]QLB22169.1 hypothetical protein A6B44_02730 [Pasteurella skyensis]SEM32258.1 hypothetical protein SAMN05444853_11248 [Pasteurella skyensis]